MFALYYELLLKIHKYINLRICLIFLFITMLSSLVKEHQSKQAVKREELEKKKKEAVVAASTLTSALVDHLNVGVAQAYLNQKRLDQESKQLHISVTNFAKQTTQWLQLVENFSQVLKEIGDVENWAKSIESDMRTISSALEYAYKVGQDET
ncbi:biogenesis of lysosome-related organelles complex 1 subunit 1-like [Uloborus diversus]|uniref:biogenesis of lysosome-related organelles complex 1 subunit 1-like n=1 Tax=Uloborus diversus TaxID=327109 RepID=UPI00240A5C54|nr:biogenesis of lysosome-related organelles complex 1 subunit 1-like [Uloborus diversus]